MPPYLPIAMALLLTSASLAGCRTAGTPGASLPEPGPAGTVSGTARFEGQTLHEGLLVRLRSQGLSRETRTDARGRYSFEGVPYGAYSLEFEQPRYFAQHRALSLSSPGESVATVTLSNHRAIYASPTLYNAAQAQPLTSLVPVPDGSGLAFVEDGKLKRIALDGSEPRLVRDFGLEAPDRIDSFDWTGAGLAYAVVASGSSEPRHELWRTTGPDPAGSARLATSSAGALMAPAFSPDGTAIAYLARVQSAWSAPDLGLSGQAQLAIVAQDAAGGESTLARYPIHPLWDFGFGPIQWTARGILFHRPMFCTLSTAYGQTNGDGLFLLDPSSAQVKKLWFYSAYDHALSPDAEWVYFRSGRSLLKRRLDDPRAYDLGAASVGYDASLQVGSLCPSPAGDRLFYVSGRGIEEMIPLE